MKNVIKGVVFSLVGYVSVANANPFDNCGLVYDAAPAFSAFTADHDKHITLCTVNDGFMYIQGNIKENTLDVRKQIPASNVDITGDENTYKISVYVGKTAYIISKDVDNQRTLSVKKGSKVNTYPLDNNEMIDDISDLSDLFE